MLRCTPAHSCSVTRRHFSSVSQAIKAHLDQLCCRVHLASTPNCRLCLHSLAQHPPPCCFSAVQLQSTGKAAANTQDMLPSCWRRGGNTRSSKALSFAGSTNRQQTFARCVFGLTRSEREVGREKISSHGAYGMVMGIKDFFLCVRCLLHTRFILFLLFLPFLIDSSFFFYIFPQ